MKKVLLCLDSFKETFSSKEINNLIKSKLSSKFDYQFRCVPISDGGEGLIDGLIESLQLKIESFEVVGPNFEKIIARVGFTSDNIAIIESAEVVGFKNQTDHSRATNTTTYGVGQLIKICEKRNVQKIYLGLGGTITNDGGCGALCALGVKFFDKTKREFIPVGATLNEIDSIDRSNLKIKSQILLLSDVKNPLIGESGATMVYAKQKRASEFELVQMEEGMKNYLKKTTEVLNSDFSNKLGSGAAGGLGFALISYCLGIYSSGIKTVIELLKLEDLISESDLVITGEGRLDKQSINGKAVTGILDLCIKHNIDCIAIAGSVENEYELRLLGFKNIYPITTKKINIEEIQAKKFEYLDKLLDKICI